MRVFLVVMLLMLLVLPVVFAGDFYDDDDTGGLSVSEINYKDTPVNKLERGVLNSATFWAEIPASIAKVSRETDPALGITLGTAQGLINAVVRGVSGLFDTFTCLLPPYNKPLVKPEYALTSADEEFKKYLW